MPTPLLEGFPPIIDGRARLLVLGSFPSVQSLAVRQYYANPQNAFWRITSELFGFDEVASYESRLEALQSHGVALWDVLHKCRRKGSSDAMIDPKTMVVNDFAVFFVNYPEIEQVYFNGDKTAQIFRRLVRADRPVRSQRLPSTSSARAMCAADKLAAWRTIIES